MSKQDKRYSPSAERGPSSIAQKAQYHQDHSGSMMAIRSGDPALRTEATSTR